MKTITVKVKFKMTGEDKTKTVKIGLEFPSGDFPCFSEIVDKVYKSMSSPKLNRLFGVGYIIGVEQVFN